MMNWRRIFHKKQLYKRKLGITEKNRDDFINLYRQIEESKN